MRGTRLVGWYHQPPPQCTAGDVVKLLLQGCATYMALVHVGLWTGR